MQHDEQQHESNGQVSTAGRRRAADSDAVPVWRRALLTRRAAARYLSMSPAKMDRFSRFRFARGSK